MTHAPRVLWITPPLGSLEAFEACLDRLAAPTDGVVVLLRRKSLSARALFDEAKRLRRSTRNMGLPLLVQRVDLALIVDADGVHLPESGMDVADARRLVPFVGASRHDREGLVRAFDQGADYCTLSPVFESPGKGPALGVAEFTRCAAGLGPVLALGGVTDTERATRCVQAGAAGVATIRGIQSPADLAALRACLAHARLPS